MEDFNLKKFLVENKLTIASKMLVEQLDSVINITNKDNDTMGVDILDNGEKVGNIGMDTYDDGKTFTIVGADIDDKSRGKGLYQKALLQVLDKYPDIIIYSAFRSPEAERAWKALQSKVGSSYNITKLRQDGEIVYKLSKG